MPNVTFIDTPGRLYDLYFLFVLHFNKDNYLSDSTNLKRRQEDIAHYTHLLESFPDFSEDLRLFFQLNTSNSSLMTRFYFDRKISKLINGEYDLAAVRQELSNIPQVTGYVLQHYFPDLSKEDREACKQSISYVNKIIKTSSHPAEIKTALYDFFIDPDIMLRQLSDELLEKSFMQKIDCERNHTLYHDLRTNFDYAYIAQELIRLKNVEIDLSDFEETKISFCIYAKSTICSRFSDKGAILLLGSDYTSILTSLQDGSMYPDLKTFGQAISDTNRVAILDLIDQKGKVSAKDVEQELNLSAPNAYYHLSLMIKSGLLSATNVGKSVFYSINGEYIQALKRRLDYYLQGKERT